MRIFRAEERHRAAVLQRSIAPESSPVPAALPARLYYGRYDLRTAQCAIAHSRAMLERTANLPGLHARQVTAMPLEAQQRVRERFLGLRKSQRETLRTNRRALRRAEEIFERTQALIAAGRILCRSRNSTVGNITAS